MLCGVHNREVQADLTARERDRRRNRHMKRLILTLALATFIISTPLSTFADVQLTLQWDANTEPDLAGYRLYLRTEGTP